MPIGQQLVFLACVTIFSAHAQEHWVATWAAAPEQSYGPIAITQTPKSDDGRGGTPVLEFDNQTIRMVVNTSIGGRVVRVELANTFGDGRLKVGSAYIALRGHDSTILPASARQLMFGGVAETTIPPGASMLSDPVELAVPALGDVVVSLYLPGRTGSPTVHSTGLHTTYVSHQGDFSAQTDFPVKGSSDSWYFLTGLHVLAPADTGLVVALGDSITDGESSTIDSNRTWPSQLSRRLLAAGIDLAVVNQGISGNRLLLDAAGANALARFDRDVLAQPGVRYLIFLEGINDILAEWAFDDEVTVEQIRLVYAQMIARARAHGIKVIGATLTPYGDASYYSESADAIRRGVNNWLRTTDILDGQIDFDAAVRDPLNPKRLRPVFTKDFLHPNDTGYAAMANAIDLSIFVREYRLKHSKTK